MTGKIVERINDFLSDRGIKKVDLAKQIGWSHGKVISQLNGNRNISVELIVTIFDAYPELSKDYVFTGKGSIYGSNERSTDAQANEIAALKKVIREKEATIKVLKSLIK